MKMRSAIQHIDYDANCVKSRLVIALEPLLLFYRDTFFRNVFENTVTIKLSISRETFPQKREKIFPSSRTKRTLLSIIVPNYKIIDSKGTFPKRQKIFQRCNKLL